MKRALLVIAAGALVARPAVAETPASAVVRARAAGQVGERFDGYLGLVVDSGPLLRHQVQAINILRRSIYSQFATSRGVTLQEVGITAGCQLLGTVGVGESYALTDRAWRVRGAGQVAPVPGYCR